MSQLIDLSHTIFDGLVTYKGLPAPIICDYLSRQDSEGNYEDGTSFQIGKIELISNTGTYIDCPFHRYQEGKDLSQIQLNQMAQLPGILVSIPAGISEITEEYFKLPNLKGCAVLVHTNWCQHWNTPAYFEKHPYLNESAAQYLKEQQVALVGIDSYNIDNTSKNSRPVHSVLLKNDILIVEHMRGLEQLTNTTFKFSAVPPKIEGMGTFPVRAYAEITT